MIGYINRVVSLNEIWLRCNIKTKVGHRTILGGELEITITKNKLAKIIFRRSHQGFKPVVRKSLLCLPASLNTDVYGLAGKPIAWDGKMFQVCDCRYTATDIVRLENKVRGLFKPEDI